MRALSRSRRAFRFGAFAADLRSGELYKDGARVRLQEQPFRILGLLLERPGEVLTREELRQKLWPNDTFVDFDHGINVAIAKIREALGDSSDFGNGDVYAMIEINKCIVGPKRRH